MAAKRIAFDQEAREAIRRGVKQLARAVNVTLGPRGRAVLLEKKWGAPIVSVDCVSASPGNVFTRARVAACRIFTIRVGFPLRGTVIAKLISYPGLSSSRPLPTLKIFVARKSI